jgi:2-keto-4-pentenoate hydratase/2-oxohepta-3-ene-1,7-dioic acid hydratase in catechol pathway
MKIVNYLADGIARIGFLVDDRVIDLEVCAEQIADTNARTLEVQSLPNAIVDLGDPGKLSIAREAYRYAEEHSSAGRGLSETELLSPVERPSNVFWIDGNYPIHNLWEDKKLPLPTDFSDYAPAMYLRPSSSVIGHGGTMLLPEFVEKAWASAELGLVVGKEGRHVRSEDAAEYILGYTVAIDGGSDMTTIHGRKVDVDESDNFGSMYGKYLDTISPIGPCLVPRDDIDIRNLRITLQVNGQIMQDFSTKEMFFSMEDIIETASSITTLRPGDVFDTGSHGRKPFTLKNGDVVEAEIEKIGKLRVHIRKEEEGER